MSLDHLKTNHHDWGLTEEEQRRSDRTGFAMAILIAVGALLCAYNMTIGVTIGLINLLPIIIAIELGKSRDRTGWMWGLFLGWLGVFILACMRARPRQLDA